MTNKTVTTMKMMITFWMIGLCITVNAQKKHLRDDKSIPIPAITFDAQGEIRMTPSATS